MLFLSVFQEQPQIVKQSSPVPWVVQSLEEGKEKSCSYIIQFQEDGNDEFGIVQYYFYARNTGFAFIHKFEKEENICSWELDDPGWSND